MNNEIKIQEFSVLSGSPNRIMELIDKFLEVTIIDKLMIVRKLKNAFGYLIGDIEKVFIIYEEYTEEYSKEPEDGDKTT
jgi:hypothetical protein